MAYTAALSSGDAAVDGGAHSGKHTIPMAQLVGSRGHVYAFEPLGFARAQLVGKIAESDFKQVSVSSLALADYPPRSIEFLYFPERPGVSGMKRRTDQAGSLDAEVALVETTTLDTLRKDRRPINFVKLDVEGAELLALRGARRLVERHHPVIHVEASFISWDAFGYGPEELLDFCARYDYTVYDVVGTPMTGPAELAASFRTAGVWDYLLLPANRSVSNLVRTAVKEHASTNYGI